MKNSLTIINLTKSFQKKVILKNITFQLQTGDIIGLFGSNGSGKSTILKILFGTLKADSLLVQLNSVNLDPQQIIQKKIIGYLPQETFLPKHLKVRNAIPLFYKTPSEQEKIFYAPNVAKFDNTLIGKLSMGELRYLELLLIGNLDHPFLLLDEPFSMIEPLYKDIIKDQLKKISSTKGILITDHYYDDVLQITTKNLLVKNTELLQIKSVSDLKSNGYI